MIAGSIAAIAIAFLAYDLGKTWIKTFAPKVEEKVKPIADEVLADVIADINKIKLALNIRNIYPGDKK